MISEKTFRRRVDLFLKTLKHTYAMSVQQISIGGDPDKILCSNGRFVGLELKKDDGVLSKLQEVKLKKIAKCGGVAMVARPSNFDEMKVVLTKLDRGETKW